MTKKEKALEAVRLLEKEYTGSLYSLDAQNPFQLLIATRLSAQCTDARVNLITPNLFDKYPSMEALAQAEQEDVEKIIHSCGFYRQKSKDIIGIADMLLKEYDGKIPDTIEDLVRLPGVGRKTANIMVGDVYGKPAVVADTHVIRITNLLGLVKTKDPLKVEMGLRKLLPPEKSNDFCHRLVFHGRAVCVARRPACGSCVMADICDYNIKTNVKGKEKAKDKK